MQKLEYFSLVQSKTHLAASPLDIDGRLDVDSFAVCEHPTRYD